MLGQYCDTTEHLAERLVSLCPGELNHVFFSSDGASAVEAAIKMSIQYWRQCAAPQPQKTRFLTLGMAYHGDTTGGVSLGDIRRFHEIFSPLLFSPVRGPVPCSYRLPPGVSREQAAAHYAAEIERLVACHQPELAALVIEPLVQGAAGMVTHPPGLLARIREVCDRFQVLLICDEVATGFGRTGRLFACEYEDVVPDILCLGKGLTGGYLPMSATITTTNVFEAFLGESHEQRQFFHGHTYGGNPLAAAVALASLDLIASERWLTNVSEKSERLIGGLHRLSDHPNVGDIRGRGMMLGIEFVQDRKQRTKFAPGRSSVGNICKRCLEQNVWIRPLGDVLVVMPPLSASDDELEMLIDVVVQAVETEESSR
jgi:adenosylmethionine-8-amino-7-oxononanoate aminotransferase